MKNTCPICGMTGTIPAYNEHFCSTNCKQKYEEKNNIKKEETYHSCSHDTSKHWYKQRLFIILIFTTVALILTYFYEPEQKFFNAFIEYIKLIWWAILLGFFIGGIIDYFIPNEYIEKYLSRHRKRTILYSIVFGFLMSACSHGILAIAIELYKKGANTASVVAFLLASPWANLPITILLFGFFGIKALYIIISAIIIATTTGLIFQVLERKGLVECRHCERGEDKAVLTEFSIRKDIKKRWGHFEFTSKNIKQAFKGTMKGSWSLTNMIMWWLIVGMLMAAVVRAYIPHSYFEQYMGPTILGLLITLFFATIIEVCSEGSSPLAFEIYDKSVKAGAPAFGNSFTFLMVGVATDYTEIGLIWHNIGKRAALWIPIITVPQILILGFIFNQFV